ncbi:CoA pyrophosphatase [Xylophilus rhododendri]|uniref:CoA pyrophosphatase n=1 Tax=Xylophilus rhododendri TaxID=2697032 RepID=A0A857J8J7_9BURK|nr:CoA pyrophosphatase [Xylophilus rhododendri]QHJ00295.1 CoA pyrophosphatase [Xylophilus rhododendri]
MIQPPPNDPEAQIPLTKLPGFDARQVPVAGVDSHLPAVPAERLAPDALRERLLRQPEWIPDMARDPMRAGREPRAAAVLVGIVLRPEGPTVLLTERTAHLSSHSGQVAFPGGRTDPEDDGPIGTALREAHEEVGLEARFVEVLGLLPTYGTVSAYVVTPVVALVAPDFTLTPHDFEVADVFEAPLSFLMDPANHRRHRMDAPDGRREWLSMPWTDPATGKQHFIWGATAGMLRNLYRLLVT